MQGIPWGLCRRVKSGARAHRVLHGDWASDGVLKIFNESGYASTCTHNLTPITLSPLTSEDSSAETNGDCQHTV